MLLKRAAGKFPGGDIDPAQEFAVDDLTADRVTVAVIQQLTVRWRTKAGLRILGLHRPEEPMSIDN